jgi:hypothetical protein
MTDSEDKNKHLGEFHSLYTGWRMDKGVTYTKIEKKDWSMSF